jgi:VWFA-related protein
MRSFLLAGGLALGLAGTALLAEQQAPSQDASQPKPSFATGGTAVVVDVVVRDKSGKPITDLKAEDFELLEDDVPQTIGDVALVAPAAPTGAPGAAIPVPPAGAPNAASNTVTAPTFVALAFDRLSPEGRALANKGAAAYLESAKDNDFAGVFVVDQSLVTVQTYTSDRERLKKALDQAATRATGKFDKNADRMMSGKLGNATPGTSMTASAEEAGPAIGATPTNPGGVMASVPTPGQGTTASAGGLSEALLARVVNRMERSYESMMRDEQGFATTNGLLALIDSLSLLPGRKSVVFFAESLAIPPAVQARFDSLVAMANRANVSFYTIDAAGLRVHSSQTETALNVNAIGNAALDRNPEAGGKLTEALEFNEDNLRKDPSVSLKMLADRTGGFLINNTNNLARGFQTIDADRRFHYLLTYAPKNSDFKGEWRAISVKVPKRDAAVIRARSGYVAVRSSGTLPLLAHEALALAALDRTTPPKDLPVRGAAFAFPDAKKPGHLAVLVAADAATLQVDTTPEAYKTDFTILARIRDAKGAVIRKASQPYKLTGPAAQAGSVKQGDVLFFREPELPPGQYTLDYVVADNLAKKAGVGSVPLVVPDAKPGQLVVSSLVVVQRAEKMPASEQPDNPLHVGDLLLYPNIGEPLRKSVAKGLSFYIAITPAAGQPAPTAELELLSGAQSIGKVPMQLAAPGPDGRIRNSAQLPLASFPPGDYGLKITVTQGAAKEVREAKVRITD